MKKYTIAIIGCGSRGRYAYGETLFKRKEQFEIVSVCDIDQRKLDRAKQDWGIPEENLFLDENVFFEKKRADALVLATQDRDHVRMCTRALQLGYDVLLEKPISPVKEELEELLAAQKQYGGEVMVCHVLRYAPAFLKIKQVLDSGVIGKLVRLEALEQVSYWHQAHSFVRGNWRNEAETSPMIMQKCCHDLDLLQYYVGAKGKEVYSVGDLSFFTKENQPEGAADTCKDCKYINECPYSAERLYIERWKHVGCPADSWPYNVVDMHKPNTEQTLRAGYENSGYGRCVFACDNDVVDNQMVAITFENGVKATLTMTAFTSRGGRKMVFHGTHGEMELDESAGTFRISPYGQEQTVLKISEIIAAQAEDDSFGHGGGDARLVHSFYDMLDKGKTADTSLESSVESHLLALAAEESRKTGKIVRVHS